MIRYGAERKQDGDGDGGGDRGKMYLFIMLVELKRPFSGDGVDDVWRYGWS